MGRNLTLKVEAGVSFRRKQAHELAKSIRELHKGSTEIIKKLETLCDSKDEKIALEACKAYISTLVSMTENKNRDEMQRLIAEAKLGGPKNLVEDDDEDRRYPQVNFSDIIDVE